uniref:Uncharacterized protein n=1 Tax=Arundo donax TaxID=35708 RepID=A0A0A9BDB3_ARUDO
MKESSKQRRVVFVLYSLENVKYPTLSFQFPTLKLLEVVSRLLSDGKSLTRLNGEGESRLHNGI